MNRQIVFALAVCGSLACATAPAKVEAPPAPPPPAPVVPADPAPVVEGDVTVAQLAGMQVIVKRIPGAELFTASLYLRGGARNWGKDDAGIEALAMHVATTGGAGGLDKAAFARQLATLGGELFGNTDRDDSIIQCKGPLTAFAPLFKMTTDALLHPALPDAELELARQQQLLSLKLQGDQPDGRLAILMNSHFNKGRPYENPPLGTEESVAKITPAQLAAHLDKLRQTSRIVLVVVGDVDAKQVLALSRAAFANVPEGSWAPQKLPPLAFPVATLVTEARKLPTNYIQGMFTAPSQRDPDYAIARVATMALSERLFDEVRTKRNLSYAPGTRYDTSADASLAGIYVTAVDPDTTIGVMLGELHKLQDTPMGDAELTGIKAKYRTRFLMGAQTTDGQADLLAMGEIRTGDWRFAQRLLEQVNTVTPAQVQAYAKKYAGRMQFVMLGDPAKLDPKLATSF